MTQANEAQLANLLTGAGVGWLLADERDVRLSNFASELQAVADEYVARFPARPRSNSILNEVAAQAHAFKPFIQCFATPMSTQIRTMVYCILVGGSVQSISYEYELKLKSILRVRVEFDTGEGASFESDNLWDAEALRHFGMMKLSGRPVVDGYFAFRDA